MLLGRNIVNLLLLVFVTLSVLVDAALGYNITPHYVTALVSFSGYSPVMALRSLLACAMGMKSCQGWEAAVIYTRLSAVL
jgi:hypothetical protein